MNKVYIIKVYSYTKKREELLATAYDTRDNAVRYCLDKLTQEEKIKHINNLQEGIITCNEFWSKEYLYAISELELK